MNQPKTPFMPLASSPDFPRMEEEIQTFWESEHIFEKTVQKDAPRGPFVFFEGPPTANNKAHIGHVLTRVVKDLFPRYRTMCGYRVERKGGWDTHGLPVEIAIEKSLGLEGKEQIEAYGVEAFNRRCFDSVRMYEREWVKLSNRIGFWLDYDNAYFTFTNKYIESVWWLLARLFKEGRLFQGHKVLPYCPLCGTTHSSHEVAQAYEEVSDPSVYARFRLQPGQTLVGEDGATFTTHDHTYALAWTTTPWTLPSNVALAVHPDHIYKLVQSAAHPTHLYLIAEDLTQPVEEAVEHEGKHSVVDLRNQPAVLRIRGSALQGVGYERLFDWGDPPEQRGWYLATATYVTLDDGTGIVHTAPAFGEEDYQTARRHQLPFITALGPDGRFKAEVPGLAGLWFKDGDREVIGDLKRRGLLFRSQKVLHSYPHCWRHGTPLYFSATASWFIRTTEVQAELVANNQKINWSPDHIKNGRFGKWLEGVIDWALSRKRYWGTPLPVWECPGCKAQDVIGSYAELFERSGRTQPADPYDQAQFNPHRPFIDDVELDCTRCGQKMKRVVEVIDCWFDAGAMPFAQHHYPFENKDLIDQQIQFPADFISEAIDQTRGWFYTLHAISTLITGQPAYKNCLVLGHVLDGEGRKMSKRLGNVIDPWEVVQAYGADPFRWHFYASMAPGQPSRFSIPLVREATKSFLLPVWNAASFFTIYANIDGWTPGGDVPEIARRPALDRWILSRLQGLVEGVRAGLDHYDILGATQAISSFVDGLNNWYIRRSRDRFWGGDLTEDKKAAYATLYQVLTTFARIIAPFVPFTAEKLYLSLERPYHPEGAVSIHLTDYPEVDASLKDTALETAMASVLRVVNLGLAARNKSNIKVRQPLASLSLVTLEPNLRTQIEPFQALLLDELNVLSVLWATDRGAYVTYRVKPNFRKLGSRFGKMMPTVKAIIEAADPSAMVVDLEKHGAITLEVEGTPQSFTAEEVEIQMIQREDTVTAADESLLVALDTRVSPELRRQGLAREVINRISGMRRDADLAYTDRIRVTFEAEGELEQALIEHQALIQSEVLATEFTAGAPGPHLGFHRSEDVEGLRLSLSVEVVK